MYFYWEQKSSRLNDTNEISPGIIVKKEHSTVNASSNSGTRQRTNVRTENNVQIKIRAIPHRKKVPNTAECDIIKSWINR